jgi:hypothetical protein
MLQTRYGCLGNMMAMPEPGRENGKYTGGFDQAKQGAGLVALGARQHAILGSISSANWSMPARFAAPTRGGRGFVAHRADPELTLERILLPFARSLPTTRRTLGADGTR